MFGGLPALLCLFMLAQDGRALPQQVCYKDIGCFDNQQPALKGFDYLPQNPKIQEIKFWLKSRGDMVAREALDYLRSSTITESSFDPAKDTMVVINGHLESLVSDWVDRIELAVLLNRDMNIITMDWSEGEFSLWYAQQVANTRVVGAVLARMVNEICNLTGADPQTFHLVGFSLGAHAAGLAGKRIPGLGRITGLDPAGPLFETWPSDLTLDKSDADFVDVIHTSSNTINRVDLGITRPVGDIDFYPNGGYGQPGCQKLAVVCDHWRALSVFVASLEGRKMEGYPCNSMADYNSGKCSQCDPGKGCPQMGYNANQAGLTGTYYLTTGPNFEHYEIFDVGNN